MSKFGPHFKPQFKKPARSGNPSNKHAGKTESLIYEPNFVSAKDRAEILKYLGTLHPIWEQRYSANNPPPEGAENRWLLRPVYWLGNWQFACLNYYHPPKGILHRCVESDPYPPVLAKLVEQMQQMVHQRFAEKDIPRGWHLNTCLINFYGDRLVDGKAVDCARVGEHKDFEPGPVGSISFGEKAVIQFVRSAHRDAKSEVVVQQWLEDSSLQLFGGEKFKKQLFHRVQRVEEKTGFTFALPQKDFTTRRINFTFRYVPNEHLKPFSDLPAAQKSDVQGYVEQLAQHSEFWKSALKNANS